MKGDVDDAQDAGLAVFRNHHCRNPSGWDGHCASANGKYEYGSDSREREPTSESVDRHVSHRWGVARRVSARLSLRNMGMMRAGQMGSSISTGASGSSAAAMMDMMMDSSDRRAYGQFMRMRGETMKALGDGMIRYDEMIERLELTQK